MDIDKKRISQFQKKILSWYHEHQRDLPWRKTRDPYKILVSEVMSQQTQIQRVIPKYIAWLEAFPTVEGLAEAKVSDVLIMWSGLGYNRRALNLQKAAKAIMKEHNGVFPQSSEELEKLPGIGRYTSRALLCFAFDVQVAVIDTNIRKVIAVEFCDGVLPPEKTVEEIAQKILPKGRAYEWNQALMDYAGAMLKDHKIPVPKQSHFFTSNRYFRGQIMKVLLVKQQMSLVDLLTYFQHEGRPIEKEKLSNIVKQLQKEGFLVQENDLLKLSGL